MLTCLLDSRICAPNHISLFGDSVRSKNTRSSKLLHFFSSDSELSIENTKTSKKVADTDAANLRFIRPPNRKRQKYGNSLNEISSKDTNEKIKGTLTMYSRKASTLWSCTVYGTSGQHTHTPHWRSLRCKQNCSGPCYQKILTSNYSPTIHQKNALLELCTSSGEGFLITVKFDGTVMSYLKMCHTTLKVVMVKAVVIVRIILKMAQIENLYNENFIRIFTW